MGVEVTPANVNDVEIGRKVSQGQLCDSYVFEQGLLPF